MIMKPLLYGTAIVILAVSMAASGAFYKRSQYYADEADIFAAGVLDFAERLHLADDEPQLYVAQDELSRSEKIPGYTAFYAHTVYTRMCVASAVLGLFLFLVLIYYGHTHPGGKIPQDKHKPQST
jgi:hypothetical protein